MYATWGIRQRRTRSNYEQRSGAFSGFVGTALVPAEPASQTAELLPGEFPVLPRFKPVERKFSNLCANEPKRRVAHGCGHFAHLSVSSLTQDDFQPRRGDGLPVADRNGTWRQDRLMVKQTDFCGACEPTFDNDSRAKAFQRLFGRNAVYLNGIGFGMAKSRIGETPRHEFIVRQEKEALTVGIQSPHGIEPSGKGTE